MGKSCRFKEYMNVCKSCHNKHDAHDLCNFICLKCPKTVSNQYISNPKHTPECSYRESPNTFCSLCLFYLSKSHTHIPKQQECLYWENLKNIFYQNNRIRNILNACNNQFSENDLIIKKKSH